MKTKIIPRMLRPTTIRDLSVELFGQKQSSPVLFAPLGVQGICHPDKEPGVAEVAAEIGVPFVFSTAASSTMEEVAEANGEGTRWYQLYWPQDHDITASVRFLSKRSSFDLINLSLQATSTRKEIWLQSFGRDT